MWFVCLHVCVLVSRAFVYLPACTQKSEPVRFCFLWFSEELFVLLRKVTCPQLTQLLSCLGKLVEIIYWAHIEKISSRENPKTNEMKSSYTKRKNEE